MSEKESPSMKALRIVYGDEVIVVQCVPRQVVKGRVLIKVHPDCRVIVSVPPETPEHELLSALKKEGAGYTSNCVISGSNRHTLFRVSMSAEKAIIISVSNIS
jgi:hypothetical protein